VGYPYGERVRPSRGGAGNIGPNAVTELDKALDAGALPDVWVLELSSFQLATTSSLVCQSAAILNVTEDHLDWHGDMKAYADAKGRIFAPTTVRVVNREDAETLRLAGTGTRRTFGASVPTADGDYGLVIREDGALWLSALIEGEEQCLMPEASLLIAGRHNAMNALAALALVESAGLPIEPALKALATYRGEPHRVAPVLTHQ
ncbi:UDP-N-acetylmuramoylalanine--D-glutamate ligase, partial [gut metagenome]